MKIILILPIGILLLAALPAHASNPFANRKGATPDQAPPATEIELDEEVPPPASARPAPAPAPTPVQSLINEPPADEDAEWVRLSFDSAETEILRMFSRDVRKLAEKTDRIALYEVRVSGQLPASYGPQFRAKLEQVMQSSSVLQIRHCPDCDQARILRTADGGLKYESYSTDPERAAKEAAELGVDDLLFAELNYTPEDLQLRVRLIDARKGTVQWSNVYATSDVERNRKALIAADMNYDPLGPNDSMAHFALGEIALSLSIATGIDLLPTINEGDGGSMAFMPAADVVIGETFDHGYKRFGLSLGGAFNAGASPDRGKVLPYAIHVGPQYRYTFNPYNVTSAKYSLLGEGGGLISTGLATGYVALGAEMTMIRKFSVSLMPMYIFNVSVSGPQVLGQSPDGTIQNVPGAKIGDYGGLGVAARVNIYF